MPQSEERIRAAVQVTPEPITARLALELLHDWTCPGGGVFGHEEDLDKLWDMTPTEECAYWYALVCVALGITPKPAKVDPEEDSNRETLVRLELENAGLKKQLAMLKGEEIAAC